MTARSIGKLAWIETKLFVRDPLTLVFTLAFPLIMFFVLAEVFGNSTADRDPGEIVYRNVGAIDYYVPAYIALVAAALGLVSLPVHLTAYRELGIFRRFRASGVSAPVLVLSEVLVTVVLTAAGGLLVGFAAAAAYGTRAPHSLAGVVLTFALTAAVFAAIGILLGSVLPSPRAAQGIGVTLYLVMLMLCGAGPPPEVLSSALRRIADGLPLTHTIRIVQDPWLGFAAEPVALLATCGFLVGATLLAVRLFRWD